jgi:hypothetical protein
MPLTEAEWLAGTGPTPRESRGRHPRTMAAAANP